ncbi:Hypothetical predicted protein [Paramuricea clavata]|uniref:Uncharacterized protein n=1 Tax=Paramuricea clavata TaxID=317549 RepID=A0A6S7FG03_PARCT|nr:Hypothetical predicted protein [Paramuricea clavata]
MRAAFFFQSLDNRSSCVLEVVQLFTAASTKLQQVQHSCSRDIQNSSYIGFWCDWSSGNGAVMMIGGGGSGCDRADHGIGVTEENEAKFGSGQGYDFGSDANKNVATTYSLNLWIR